MKYNWKEEMFPEIANCSISVSKTITQKEWEKVYKEALSLTKALDLCAVEDFNYMGVKVQCFVHPKEIKDYYLKPLCYFKADGLYSERIGIGPLKFHRYLDKEDCNQTEGSAFLGYAYSDEALSSIMLGYELEVHNYITKILALAFLIEARLPDKAFVYGTFDYSTAVESIEIINKFLKKPIGLPVICKPEALIKLVKETNFSEEEKYELFIKTYMGARNKEFWEILMNNFSNIMMYKYRKEYEEVLSKLNNNDEEEDDDYDELPNQIDNNSNTAEQEYDIESTKDLFNYKKGNTIEPKLLKNILDCFDLFKTTIEQKEYAYLSKLSPIEQIKTLSLCQKQFPLQDKDWKHAINYFLTKKDALERYYLLFMLKYEMYSPACNITRALFINDALYKFCHNLYSTLSR